MDLATTLCSLAGLEALETSDGKDISGLLRGGSGEVHRVGVTEFAWSKSVRQGNIRLVCYPPQMFPEQYPEGFGELYDLRADPWEMKNLYFDPAHAAKVRELERDLLDWLVSTTRPTTTLSLPNFDGPQFVTRYRNSVNADRKFNPDRLRDLRHRNYL